MKILIMCQLIIVIKVSNLIYKYAFLDPGNRIKKHIPADISTKIAESTILCRELIFFYAVNDRFRSINALSIFRCLETEDTYQR